MTGRGSVLPVVRLGDSDAGELLTLQRAAFVVEAQAHDDPHLPPLTETLDELRGVFAGPDIVLGAQDHGRLIGAGRLAVSDEGTVAHIGRLAAAPDRQGEGLGRLLITALEAAAPDTVVEFRPFTGSTAHPTCGGTSAPDTASPAVPRHLRGTT